MRLTLLAALTMMAIASPALAQLPSHRASYQPRAASGSYKYTGYAQTHVEATVASHGYGEYGDGTGGCACGHPSRFGRNCGTSIFPDVIDNIEDAFINLIPTRAHCCPYPKVCVPHKVYTPPTCNDGCHEPLFNRLFGGYSRCNGGCSSCSSCSSCTKGEPSCGCTSKGVTETELLTPPKTPAVTPFGDDPEEAPAARGAKLNTKRSVPKTTSTAPGWYKTVRPTPATVMRLSTPGVIAVGNASPITIRE